MDTTRIRRFLSRHLFAYLAVLALVVVSVAAFLAREALVEAWRSFDRRLALPILGLSLLNYVLRFLKWHWQLRAVGGRVSLADDARVYFACLTMVVTPFRLGELYKLVFLRRLHGLPVQRTGPVLVAERLTDVLAILALASVGFAPDTGRPLVRLVGLLALTLVTGLILGRPPVRDAFLDLLRRFSFTRKRADDLAAALAGGARLFSAPLLLPALVLSVAAWFAECVGLYLILVGLGTPISWVTATWIYAAGTIAGNLTFLPGGLVGTEAALVGLLRQQGVAPHPAAAATLLVRGATLWFAVLLGLVVTLAERRKLGWKEAQREAADYSAPGS